MDAIQLVGTNDEKRSEDTKMKKTICAADLTASNYDEARAILNQMETVVDWTFSQGLFTVEYTTDDQDAIEKDWREACAFVSYLKLWTMIPTSATPSIRSLES